MSIQLQTPYSGALFIPSLRSKKKTLTWLTDEGYEAVVS